MSRTAPAGTALRAWTFGLDQGGVPVTRADLAGHIAAAETVLWVDLSGYAEEELREVAALLSLPRQAVRATLAPWHRPRLALYADHLFVSVTVPRLDPDAYQVQAGELDLVVGRNLVVSAHKAPLPFDTQLHARLLASPAVVQRDAPMLLYSLLDEVLSYYEELHRHLQVEIERLEERALHDASDRFLADLVRFKRYAFALSQLADQHRDVVAAFGRPDFPWVAGTEAAESFEDLQSRLTRLIDLLLAAKDAVNGAFEIHVSHMSHRTNQVIRLLTIVSVVLFTASIIVSIFGTTIAATMHNSVLATPFGLFVMLVCMVLVSMGTLWAFHRRQWL